MFPSIKVLALSTFDDDGYIAETMQAGAKGYLLKDMPSEDLAQAIRFVYRGYSQLAPGLLDRLIAGVRDVDPVSPQAVLPKLPQLTAREKDVLHLIASGATNREIADQLYVAEGTVKTHVTHLLNRLNMKNRSQLAIYAHSVFGKAEKL